MSRSRVKFLGSLALAGVSGCQLLIGLDHGLPESGGSSSTSSVTTGSTSSSSSTGGSGGTGGTSGSGGTGGTSGSGGTGGTSSSSSSSSGGDACDAGACTAPEQCPDPGTVCVIRTCDGGCCGTAFADAGTGVGEAPNGDCHKLVCDGSGATKEDVDDTDIPAGTECSDGYCSAGTPSWLAKPAGTTCTAAGGRVCGDDSLKGSCVECNVNADCASDVCATCSTGSKVCGNVPAVNLGECVECKGPGDCLSGVCGADVCQAPPDCQDGVKNGAETDVDCGDTCAPCATGRHCSVDSDCLGLRCTGGVCVSMVLLAGGGAMDRVVAGSYDKTGGGWNTTELTGVTSVAASIAVLPSTGHAVGIVRTIEAVADAGAPSPLRYTLLDATGWSALTLVNTAVAQSRPSIAVNGGKVHMVYLDDVFHLQHETFAGSWSAPAEVITPPLVWQCSPNGPALAPWGSEVTVLFVNGQCDPPLNSLFNSDMIGGVWQTYKNVAGDPSSAAQMVAAIVALPSGLGPDLLAVYVTHAAPGARQIKYSTRTGGTWSSSMQVHSPAYLTDDPVALVSIAGGAVLAYRGTDKKLYTVKYTSTGWSELSFTTTPSTAATPAVARGVGAADAELVYVDGGSLYHTRLTGPSWSTPASIPFGTPYSFAHVALSSAP